MPRMPAPGTVRPSAPDPTAGPLAGDAPAGCRGPRRYRRAVTGVLVAVLATGLAACSGDDEPSPSGTTSASPTDSPKAGWVRAQTPTVTADFPENWVRINDPDLRDGIAARSPEASDGSRAVVTIRILGVGLGDAQQIGDSPATAAADQTLSQLGEKGIKGAKAESGLVARRPGWILTWDQANTRDPAKQIYRHVWGVADVGSRQFVLVSAQAPAKRFGEFPVEDILATVQLPLAVPPTSTPTETPDGSGDVVVGEATPTPTPSQTPSP